MADHVRDRLLDYLYEELDDGERRDVETHLESCEACQAAFAEIAGTRALMSRLPEEAPDRGVEFVVQAAEREARLRRARPAGLLGRLGGWIVRHPVSTSVAVASAAVLVVVTVDRTKPGGIVTVPTAATAAAPAKAPAKTLAAPQGVAQEDEEAHHRSLKGFEGGETGRKEKAPRANARTARLEGKVAAKNEDAAPRDRTEELQDARMATIQIIKGREATRAHERSRSARHGRRLEAKKRVSDIVGAGEVAGVVGGLGAAPSSGGGGLRTGGSPARAEAPPPAHHHRARQRFAHRAEAPPRAPAGPAVAAAAPPPPMAPRRAEAPEDLAAPAAAAPVARRSRRPAAAPPRRPARLDAAIRALDAHAPKRALSLLDALLAGNPQGPWVAEARFQRCRCLAALGKRAEAEKDCRAAAAGGGPFGDRARRLLDRLTQAPGGP